LVNEVEESHNRPCMYTAAVPRCWLIASNATWLMKSLYRISITL
jgi:hypothetical protein